MQSGQALQMMRDQGEDQLLESALVGLSKALKAIGFYPKGHPLREESVNAAVAALQPLIREKELILLWNREGCTVAERALVRSVSATAKALARDMLSRKLQKLIILPALSQNDLSSFLAVMATEPAVIYAQGGIEPVMLKTGVTSIGVNEVNLSLLRSREPQEDQDDEARFADDSAEPEDPEQAQEQKADDQIDIEYSLLGMDILLGMIKGEKRDPQFMQLVREIIDAADVLKRQEAFHMLLPAFDVLLDIHAAESRPPTQQEFVRYALEQIASGAMTSYLMERIEERSAENRILLDKLCTVIGQSLAYPLIQRLCVTESLHARKTIAIALAQAGEGAIPALVAMLKDERWYVVRNMVAILGEIGSPEAVGALKAAAQHPEPKVRKEVIKALVKISPRAAEQTLIAFMDDIDDDVARQAVYFLGTIRSKVAVRQLLEIVTASDALLKGLTMKKKAVSALGRIGDHDATEALMRILATRGWLAPVRWQELKLVAAAALGQLGDEAALPLLKKLARSSSPLGKACGDAVDNIERLVK